MCISVVAPSGDLVYFERMDNCQYASIKISQHKARAAAIYRRSIKTFADRIAQGGGGLTVLTLDDVVASGRWLPLGHGWQGCWRHRVQRWLGPGGRPNLPSWRDCAEVGASKVRAARPPGKPGGLFIPPSRGQAI
jgi:hypothetical protein